MPEITSMSLDNFIEDEIVNAEELPSDIHQVNEPVKKHNSFVSRISKPPLLKSLNPSAKKRLNIPEAFMQPEVDLNGK